MRGDKTEDLTSRLANVARLTPHAIVLCDAAGQIDWVNDGFTAMTGFSLADAADRLGLTENTVRTYCKTIMSKVGVGRQADLVALILRSVAVLG